MRVSLSVPVVVLSPKFSSLIVRHFRLLDLARRKMLWLECGEYFQFLVDLVLQNGYLVGHNAHLEPNYFGEHIHLEVLSKLLHFLFDFVDGGLLSHENLLSSFDSLQ